MNKSSVKSNIFAKFIVVMCISLPAFLQRLCAQDSIMRCISLDDGLPGSYVDDIMQDSRGFAWLALSVEGCADGTDTNFSDSLQRRSLP